MFDLEPKSRFWTWMAVLFLVVFWATLGAAVIFYKTS